ncbi:hypothetical protein JMJ55_13920 [Belnapia sp. T6]|uniref:Multicomponent Na+:H+ antiporter subunit F n=1 Tax=Belnapia mucosa TaxID=2804532 RepID=A0ABS1V5A5_9PROT|nr:monovalent cation/H+ antiporter complex subunit F [Belnapia mucosa]MBL6456427.1 hypothetical protein [Belnapia mucosa]
MSSWLLALLGLVPALAVPVWQALRGSIGTRLVAVQFATSLAVLMLALMSFAFAQPSLMDLALTLALLTLPGTLLLAVFLERWL